VQLLLLMLHFDRYCCYHCHYCRRRRRRRQSSRKDDRDTVNLSFYATPIVDAVVAVVAVAEEFLLLFLCPLLIADAGLSGYGR
jgi:hypothetical protein